MTPIVKKKINNNVRPKNIKKPETKKSKTQKKTENRASIDFSNNFIIRTLLRIKNIFPKGEKSKTSKPKTPKKLETPKKSVTPKKTENRASIDFSKNVITRTLLRIKNILPKGEKSKTAKPKTPKKLETPKKSVTPKKKETQSKSDNRVSIDFSNNFITRALLRIKNIFQQSEKSKTSKPIVPIKNNAQKDPPNNNPVKPQSMPAPQIENVKNVKNDKNKKEPEVVKPPEKVSENEIEQQIKDISNKNNKITVIYPKKNKSASKLLAKDKPVDNNLNSKYDISNIDLNTLKILLKDPQSLIVFIVYNSNFLSDIMNINILPSLVRRASGLTIN